MPLFLDLPLEIREHIIEHVLWGLDTPPSYPSTSGRIDFKDIDYQAWRSGTKIYNEQRSTHCPSNCLPLLLTSRQVHDETRSILGRKHSRITYALDISVLNDYDLFPTWTSVPCVTNRVHALNTTVRLYGSVVPARVVLSLRGDGGRLGFHWSFYALLERFLRYGPVGEKKAKSHLHPRGDVLPGQAERPKKSPKHFNDRDLTVGVLSLDFQSAETGLPFPPDHIDYRAWRLHHIYPSTWAKSDEPGDERQKYRTRPEWLARYLSSEIYGLLNMTYHTASYGKILYERVGAIRIISPEGTTEIDLATKLAALRFRDERDTFGNIRGGDRLSTFWGWKKQTLARRQELGFPVVWPDDPELKD